MGGCGGISADPTYLYDSLTCLVHNAWQHKLENHHNCRNVGSDKSLIIKCPLSFRTLDYTKEVMDEGEIPSEIPLNRFQLATSFLLKFTECLPNGDLNVRMKQLNNEKLRETPNTTSLG